MSVPKTTYLIPVGTADVPRMHAMNDIFDNDSLNWTLPDHLFENAIKMLDVGCGNGALTIKFATKLGKRGEIVAIDRSKEQIDVARESAKKNGITNITWIVKDAYQLDELLDEYKEGFNIVHCRFLLNHLRKPAEVVNKMASVLSGEGLLVMEELKGHYYQCLPSEPLCMKVWRWIIALEHIIQGSNLSTGSHLAEMVENLGMTKVEISEPNPKAASEGQKAVFPLSLSNFKIYIPSFFHFIINPWISALQRMQKNPNYSVTFVNFIQVKAVKH